GAGDAARLGRGTGLREEVSDLGRWPTCLPGVTPGRQGPCPARRPGPRVDGGHPLCRPPGAAPPPGNELPRRKRRRQRRPHRRETVPGRPRTDGAMKQRATTEYTEYTEKRQKRKKNRGREEGER